MTNLLYQADAEVLLERLARQGGSASQLGVNLGRNVVDPNAGHGPRVHRGGDRTCDMRHLCRSTVPSFVGGVAVGAAGRLKGCPTCGWPPPSSTPSSGDLAGNVERIRAALTQAEAARRRPVRVPRAGRDRLSARGSPGQAPVRGGQRRRPGRGGPGHRALRGGRRIRRAAGGRTGPAPAAPRPTPPRSAPTAGWSAAYRKRLLPNYGVFDEQRWFVPGERPSDLYRRAPASSSASPSARTSGSTRARWPLSAAAAPSWS